MSSKTRSLKNSESNMKVVCINHIPNSVTAKPRGTISYFQEISTPSICSYVLYLYVQITRRHTNSSHYFAHLPLIRLFLT